MHSRWLEEFERPLVIAHRGASQDAPENTLAAFSLAVEQGADGIELDVQLSADGEVVVIHDFTVDATTDGSGRVADMGLIALKALDAGSWFGPQFAGERIPTLGEVFERMPADLLFNIELKLPWTMRETGLEGQVLRLIDKYGVADRVLLSSFHPLALRRVKRMWPELPVGLLYAAVERFVAGRGWVQRMIRAEAHHPHHSLVDPSLVNWAYARGIRLHPWTVDNPVEMRRLIDLGVHAIITDCPARLCDMLARCGKR